MGSWNYGTTPGSGAGTMRCTACGKQIESGRYRYRQKTKGGDWSYVTQHEACSQDDPAWAGMNRVEAAAETRRLELSDACKAFKAQWGVGDLDDYILEPQA